MDGKAEIHILKVCQDEESKEKITCSRKVTQEGGGGEERKGERSNSPRCHPRVVTWTLPISYTPASGTSAKYYDQRRNEAEKYCLGTKGKKRPRLDKLGIEGGGEDSAPIPSKKAVSEKSALPWKLVGCRQQVDLVGGGHRIR